MAAKASSKANRTDTKKKIALDAYVELGTVTAACRKAKIGRTAWYDWIEKDPAFAEKVKDAYEQVTDDLEETAIQRAKGGDTTLTIFLLKGRRKEVYGDKREISGPEGGPIPISPVEEINSRIADIAKRRGEMGGTEQPDPEGG